MQRDEFRDALRRMGEITGDRDVVVIGSQSVHGAFPAALLHAELTRSMEIDAIPLDDPDEEKSWALAVRGAVYGTEIDAACHQPTQTAVDRAAEFLQGLPPLDETAAFPPAARRPPRGRRRPTHADFP